MIDYAGKTALVTGAASGIGKALAGALAARGAKVILADVNEAAVRTAAAEVGGEGVVCDLAQVGAGGRLVTQTWAAHGPLHLVCSNAGLGRGKRMMRESRDAAVERLFEVNLFAGVSIAQAYVPLLEEAGMRGRLIWTGSENSLSVPNAVKRGAMGYYAATKHGVLILAEWMAEELRNAPIDLHVLMPGAVYTPMVAAVLPDPAKAAPELGLIMPERCAELALKGMDLGLFYIPTHAHLLDDMRPRLDGVAASLRALGLRD